MSEATITIDSRDEAVVLFGHRDQNLREIRNALGAQVVARGDTITIKGTDEQIDQGKRILQQLRGLVARQGSLSLEDVRTVLELVLQGGDRLQASAPAGTAGGGEAAVSRFVRPRTDGQSRYVRAMRDHDLTICVGPAGTGKTYLGVGMAVSLLRQNAVKKIVLVRPAVEAGERLGFLPGDLVAKVNPYLRPLFDSLHDMMEYEQVRRYMDNDIIEIVPLAFMRGRAQPLSSNVLTPRGFRPIGSLQVLDYVVGSNGQPTPVLGVFPQGRKEVYRVTMSDGSSTRCCGEHLWTVLTPEDRYRTGVPRVLETREMIGKERRNHQHRFEIPMMAPVQFPVQDVPLDPYALGLLLGDGCITGRTSPTFATSDTELAVALGERLEGVMMRHKGGVDYCITKPTSVGVRRINPLTETLRHLELLGTRSTTKFIPRWYLWNSVEVRHAVLQGLLDSDGGPVTQAGRTCRIQYTTTSPQLCQDVTFLVRSLGGVANTRIRRAAGRPSHFVRGHEVAHRNDAHIMDIRLPEQIAPFRLTRKKAVYDEHSGGRPMRFITSIEPDGVEECVCISVAAADSLYATDDFILTHNTLSNAAIILDEGQNTTVSQMKMFLTRMGQGSKIIVTGDVTQIDLPREVRSGLIDALERFKNVEQISIVYLDENDIVRHPLVAQVLKAYDETGDKRSPHRKK